MRIAKLATGRFEILGLDQSFHGLTAGVASITYSVGASGLRTPDAGVVRAAGTLRLPLRRSARERADRPGCGGCDMTCLERGFEPSIANSAGALAGTIAEPVLSAGGVIDPPPGYLRRLAEATTGTGRPAHRRRGADRASGGSGRCSASSRTASCRTSSRSPRPSAAGCRWRPPSSAPSWRSGSSSAASSTSRATSATRSRRPSGWRCSTSSSRSGCRSGPR